MPRIRVTGRIRDEQNLPVTGARVEALFTAQPGDIAAGAVRTASDKDGSFRLIFEIPKYEGEARPLGARLEISDVPGGGLLASQERENRTGRIDFQIMLGGSHVAEGEPDVYEGGFERLISRYAAMADVTNSSDQGVRDSLEYVLGVVRGWSAIREELSRVCGLDARQVPRHPRSERHEHVTRWDGVVLKT